MDDQIQKAIRTIQLAGNGAVFNTITKLIENLTETQIRYPEYYHVTKLAAFQISAKIAESIDSIFDIAREALPEHIKPMYGYFVHESLSYAVQCYSPYFPRRQLGERIPTVGYIVKREDQYKVEVYREDFRKLVEDTLVV